MMILMIMVMNVCYESMYVNNDVENFRVIYENEFLFILFKFLKKIINYIF